jgi:hypothetical protein
MNLTKELGRPNRRGLDPDDRVTITIEPDELIPGRQASRARVIAAGLTDDARHCEERSNEAISIG